MGVTAPYRAEWARETLALRIIEQAHNGTWDITELCDDALAHLAKAKFGEKEFTPSVTTNTSAQYGVAENTPAAS